MCLVLLFPKLNFKDAPKKFKLLQYYEKKAVHTSTILNYFMQRF